MLIKNTIKQLFRTPLKTILFILLISIIVAFIIIDFNLWNGSRKTITTVINSYQTIGTIEQKTDSMQSYKLWTGSDKHYLIMDTPMYKNHVPLSKLSGLPYLEAPEKRPFYYAHAPELQILSRIKTHTALFEFEPLSNYDSSQLRQVKITKSIYGLENEENKPEVVYFRNERENSIIGNEKMILKKGKRYITYATKTPVKDENGNYISAYISMSDIWSFSNALEQYSQEKVAPSLIEINEEAYSKEVLKIYYEVAKTFKMLEYTFPVIPTNNINLMIPFFNNDAYVTSGRKITPSEYKNGERVCLISQTMAQKENLSLGDELSLNLFQADFANAASNFFKPSGDSRCLWSLYNKQAPSYFYSAPHKIVGIYTNNEFTSTPTTYELGYNAVIVPSASIKNEKSLNVISIGPMQGFNTSFRIKNGSSEEFITEFAKLNLKNIDIQFYDKGYTKIIGGLNSIMTTTLILLIIAVICVIGILVFFVFIDIGKRKREIAIQLSLGTSRKKCLIQLLLNVLLVVVIGCVIGGAIGNFISKNIFEKSVTLAKESAYDTTYSNSVNFDDEVEKIDVTSVNLNNSVFTAVLVISFSLIFSTIYAHQYLRLEPMKLLSKKTE